MSFLEQLTIYLRELEEQPTTQVRAVRPSDVDPAKVRSRLLVALEKLEAYDASNASRSASFDFMEDIPEDGQKSTLKRHLDKWQNHDAIVRFARQLEHLLRASFGKESSAFEVAEWIGLAIERQLGLSSELPSKVRTLELDRLSDIAAERVFESNARQFELDPVAYAAQIRATRGAANNTKLTPVGRVFLELTGLDAIRWLLQIEAAQSHGTRDPWRLSPKAASGILDLHTKDLLGLDDPHFAFDWRTLYRLAEFGLITIHAFSHHNTIIHVLSTGEKLLDEISSGVESPMSILAGSLLTDLTLTSTESIAKAPRAGAATNARTSTASEATSRQARMVAHEIRNTLVPVKTALNAMYRELLLGAPSEILARRRDRIDRGIDATFRFIEQLVELANLAATPAEPFEPLSAIHDVLANIEQETGFNLQHTLPDALPPVSGHRARMVMALANLLRNATQATLKGSAVIRLHAEPVDAARAIRLTVEDNGPGVPENMRRAIFDEGVSLRPGGSGLGLALVREVFEKEMRGLVACDTSPLGGARFTVRIPVTGAEPL